MSLDKPTAPPVFTVPLFSGMALQILVTLSEQSRKGDPDSYAFGCLPPKFVHRGFSSLDNSTSRVGGPAMQLRPVRCVLVVLVGIQVAQVNHRDQI